MASRRRVAWTPEARRTLNEVLDFIALESADGARRVLEQVLAAARSLETLADRGRVVPELGESSVREVFVYRYRLMYRVEEESVSIVAIIHGARDFERWRSEPLEPPPNTVMQQTRRLVSSRAVRGSFGATPVGRGLSAAACARSSS